MKIKATAVVVAAVLVVVIIWSNVSQDEAGTNSVRGAPVILTQSASAGFIRRPLTEREIKRRRQAILRATQEFMHVYRRYQLDDLDRPSRRQLRAVTTRSFARALERQPARVPVSVRPTTSRTLGMTLYGDPSRNSVSVEVRTAYERAGQAFRSVMFVVLERQSQSWRVSGVR